MRLKLALVLAMTTAVVSCQRDQILTEPRSNVEGLQGGAVTEDTLFTIVAAPVLTGEQAAMLSRIRNRASSAEVHVALVAQAPRSVLQQGNAVAIDLSPARRVVVVGELAVERRTGAFSWAGALRDEPGWAQLVLTTKGVTGTLRTGDALYRFEPIGGGLHALVRSGAFPPEHPPEYPSGAVLSSQSGPSRVGPPSRTGLATSSVPTTIALLVVYTASAANASGDIEGLMQLAIDESNTSYSNSQIGILVDRVYSAQVTYNEAGRSYQQHVAALQSTSDGLMDVVHTWRNQYPADVVVLLVNDTEFCGIASQIYANQATAFGVVHYDCATGNYTFAHEIGHLQGARHDRAVDPSNSPFQYGHGYVDPDVTHPDTVRWRTIMAYGDACGFCTRLQYWSNPDVIYPPTGQAMGTATYEDNARVLNQTASYIANFRPLVSISGPTHVRQNWGNYCYWSATVTGGASPYSYAWYQDGQLVGTGSYYYDDYLYYSFTLKVVVTEAGGDSGSDSKYIQVDIDGTYC